MVTNEFLAYMKSNVDIVIDSIKVLSLIGFTYYTNAKLINQRNIISLRKVILMMIFAIIYVLIKKKINYLIGIVSLIIAISLLFSTKNIGKSILATTISLSINQIISIFASIICFLIIVLLNITNDYFYLIIIIFLHIIILLRIFKINKLKYGITFLKEKTLGEHFDILILNTSIIVLLYIMMLIDSSVILSKNILIGIFLVSIIMFITIQKSLQLYYKQKLLEQELTRTKEELENKNKEIAELESDNISISKRIHTLDHKQKALSYRIEEMMMKTEISNDEVAEVSKILNKIGNELYKEKSETELSLTEIPEIDNMLKFMQSECSKNKIDFELQIKGNMYYMINNLISKEDLETLLADHIKNAIIAINHTENINKSILVKMGKFDEYYSIVIYDSGTEFEKNTLEKLGKEPSTTHADEGGTGMGFMNTFDTLKKCKASLIIEEIDKPNKDNYTKAIIVKFDNKNQFEIKSYRKA